LADPSDVSVVIPAMNEGESIGTVVSQLRDAAAWRQLLVIDDGSTDDTARRASDAGAHVIRHPYNKGNGAAVKTAIRHAISDFVLIIDADGQHPPADALRLVSRLGEYDLVVGARDRSTQATAARRLGNTLLNWLASYLTGRRIPDLTSGFRAASVSFMC
jgi:glycosyltransferase involved in cell wall biosynthesis